jgi:hypothetical protein
LLTSTRFETRENSTTFAAWQTLCATCAWELIPTGLRAKSWSAHKSSHSRKDFEHGTQKLLIDEAMRLRIVKLRTEYNLTYVVIAKRFRISESTIKKICDMKAKP